jgi:hypothetical protein
MRLWSRHPPKTTSPSIKRILVKKLRKKGAPFLARSLREKWGFFCSANPNRNVILSAARPGDGPYASRESPLPYRRACTSWLASLQHMIGRPQCQPGSRAAPVTVLPSVTISGSGVIAMLNSGAQGNDSCYPHSSRKSIRWNIFMGCCQRSAIELSPPTAPIWPAGTGVSCTARRRIDMAPARNPNCRGCTTQSRQTK